MSKVTPAQGISLLVDCEDQKEVDEYWNKLVSAGATPSQCGWITDQFGISGRSSRGVSWSSSGTGS